MLNLLAAFLLAPSMALPQKPTLTADDVHAIEALVVEELFPADGKLDARPTKGRLLLIDPEQASAVMGKLVDGIPKPAMTIPQAFRAASHDAAVQCVRVAGHGLDCQVVNDGIYLSFSDAAFVPATGEVLIHAGVVWEHSFRDYHMLWGYSIELFFARTTSGWRLVRKGTAIVG